uniref:Glycosyltransferase family 4 protein n=2 Tax=Haloterrigena alkaliphila TaxID=2816475 RepID=A0A8A2VJ46_9EURY
MKILVITREFPPYVVGGLSYHLENLYSEVSKKGHNITVIAGRPRNVDPIDSIDIDPNIDVHWIDYPSMVAYHLQFPAFLYREIGNLSIDKYDIAVSHTELPFSLEIPTVYKFHDAKHEGRKYYRKTMGSLMKALETALQPTRSWAAQRSLDLADHLIFNSALTRKIWKREYTITSPSEVIHNGVDRDIFYPRDIENGEFVLFVGTIPRKGLGKVIDFAEKSPYPIYVAGDIKFNSDNLHSLGRLSQNQLAKYYSSAIATIHPAKFEAFGNVILESLACGTPVVVSEYCGAAEIVDDSCGRVTPNLLAGVEAVREIEQAPCVQKASKYSWENVANQTIGVFERTIA